MKARAGLPETGADSRPLLVAGGILCVLGVVVLIAAVRRRPGTGV